MPQLGSRVLQYQYPRSGQDRKRQSTITNMNPSSINELIVLVGVPGSGKSTYAAEYVAQNPNAVIVGRDKLRELLFGYTESTVQAHYQSERFREREDIVTQFQHSAISLGLQSGKVVIVDDTNCNYDRLRAMVDRYAGYGVTVKFFDTPLEECLRRNEQRTRVATAAAIVKYYDSFLAVQKQWGQDAKDANLTDKGFVFIDSSGKPYLIRMWDDRPWLFYWHADKRWVSLRTVTQMEIWDYHRYHLSDTAANMYHELNDRPLI